MIRKITFSFLLSVIINSSYAQSPVADSLFANNSLLTHGMGSVSGGGGGLMVEQTDGKIILGGHHYTAGFFEAYIDLTRFDRCGMIDSTFGVNGIASVHFDNINTLEALKLQSDGKILCAGVQSPSTAGSQQIPYLARLNSDGSPDSTFNGVGSHTQRWDNISSGVFNNIDILPDGRILATGLCGANINGGQYALGAMRFMPDGSLDTTFNSDGIFLHQSVTIPAVHSNGHLLPDNAAVLCAHLDDQNGHHSLISILIDSTGALNPSYGVAGIYTDPTIYSNAAVNFNTIDNNNNLLTVGNMNTGFTVSRILPTGIVDNSFGVNGLADFPLSLAFTPQRIYVAQNGKLMLSGYSTLGSLVDGVLQLNSDGSIDSTFGINGVITTEQPSSFLGVKTILELSNNRLMLGFSSGQVFAKKFAMFSNVPHISDNGTNLISTGGGSFQWFLNNVMINGATQNTYIYTQNGSYSAMITDVDGCTYLSDPYVVTSVGISEINSDEIIIYPNPASEKISVSFLNKGKLPEVYNSFGQKIKCPISKGEKSYIIIVRDLAPGIYFIIANENERTIKKSFVKK